MPLRMLSDRMCSVGVAALLFGAGCHARSPATMVLAQVNGEAITSGDLADDISLKTRRAPLGGQIALQRLVDRKLLAQRARQEGLGTGSAFHAARTRMEETVLANAVVNAWAAGARAPTQSDAQAFIAANPQMFSERQLYIVDQIRTREDGIDAAALKRQATFAAASSFLEASGHDFTLSATALDSRTLGPAAAHQLADLAPGAVLASQVGDVFVITAVRTVNAAPIPLAQRLPEALAVLRRSAARQAVGAGLAALRAQAHIHFADEPRLAGGYPQSSAAS